MSLAKKVEGVVQDRKITFESGWLAKQANGACLVRCGETVVFAAATAGGVRDLDFMPLTVDYRERTTAAGKFPGGFMKREGRPTTQETLVSRQIDRPIRPLFPEGWIEDTQIICQVLSYDQENLSDILVMNAASAALHVSDMAFAGPVGSVRVGMIGDRYVVNPTRSELRESKLDLSISGTREGIIMVEAGAHQVPEEQMLAAFEFAIPYIQKMIDFQEDLRKAVGRPKKEWKLSPVNLEIYETLRKGYEKKIQDVFFTPGKKAREAALSAVKDEAFKQTCPVDERGLPVPGRPTVKQARPAWDKLMDKVVREFALQKRRADGRGDDDIRPIDIEVGLLPRTHGSALFTRGETQAIVTTTLGTKQDEQIVDGMDEEYSERFMLHYNFPSFSVGETKPNRGPGRREIGHGDLAKRALEPVIPKDTDFPYTIRVVSDIYESNGSSSMATVCGATLALMDAGVPIEAPVAGIAMGLIYEGKGRVAVLTDILGSEDAHGDMDFKVAGTEKGITSLQMDLKAAGIPMEIVREALAKAHDARLRILAKIGEAIPRPRAELSRYAPRLVQIKVDTEKIGLVIGPGGKTIREMEARSGATIEIDDDGSVTISSKNAESLEMARSMVSQLTEDLEIGKIYNATVVSLKDFGAFVELEGRGQEGLVHVTEVTDAYVGNVADYLQKGMPVKVKLLSREDSGKYRFSIKAARLDAGEPPLGRLDGQPPQPRPDRGGMGGGGGQRFRDSRPPGRPGGGDRRPPQSGGPAPAGRRDVVNDPRDF